MPDLTEHLEAYVAGREDLSVARTVHGPMVVLARDLGVSDTLLSLGEFAGREIEIYESLLRDGDVFVDVGANIGAISSALLRSTREVTVWAFEPQPCLHALAVVNTMSAGRCVVLPYVVGAEERLVSIPEIDTAASGNYGAAAVRLPARHRLPTPMIRLDGFFQARGVVPRLVKIDVEGMERDVIDGALALAHAGLVLSVEADRPRRVAEWLPPLVERSDCYMLFFRHVSRRNPGIDPNHPKRHLVMPHILAFFGEVDAWFADRFAGARISGFDDYRARITWGT